MLISQFYFEDILIYADMPEFNKYSNKEFIENMRDYFDQYGWHVNLVHHRNKYKIYFYALCKDLVHANYIKMIESLSHLGYNESYLSEQKNFYSTRPENFFKEMMDFGIFGKYLEAFSIYFKYFYYNFVLKNRIDRAAKKASGTQNYSLFVNGLSFVLRVPSTNDDSLIFDIQNYFSKELMYLSDYDKVLLSLGDKIKISNDDNSNSADVKVILRFPPDSRYSLSLHTIPKDLSNKSLYKGINYTALRMFRYLRSEQIEKAEQLLEAEEHESFGDLKKLNKLKELHDLLHDYRDYKKKKELLENLPSNALWQFKSQLAREVKRLERPLKKKDFFEMCSISEMDFRALELKIAVFVAQIDPERSISLAPCNI